MGQPLRTKYSDALEVLPATLDSVGFALPLGFVPPATDARAPARGSLQGAGGMFFAAGQPGAGGGRPVLQRPQYTEGGFPPLQRADTRADAVRYGIGWERSTALARAEARVSTAQHRMLAAFRQGAAADRTVGAAKELLALDRSLALGPAEGLGPDRTAARTAMRMVQHGGPEEQDGGSGGGGGGGGQRFMVSIRESACQTEPDVLLSSHTKNSSYGMLGVLSGQAVLSSSAQAGRFLAYGADALFAAGGGSGRGGGARGNRKKGGSTAARAGLEADARRLHEGARASDAAAAGERGALAAVLTERDRAEAALGLQMDALHATLDAAASEARARAQLELAQADALELREHVAKLKLQLRGAEGAATELARAKALLSPPQLAALRDGGGALASAHRASAVAVQQRSSMVRQRLSMRMVHLGGGGGGGGAMAGGDAGPVAAAARGGGGTAGVGESKRCALCAAMMMGGAGGAGGPCGAGRWLLMRRVVAAAAAAAVADGGGGRRGGARARRTTGGAALMSSGDVLACVHEVVPLKLARDALDRERGAPLRLSLPAVVAEHLLQQYGHLRTAQARELLLLRTLAHAATATGAARPVSPAAASPPHTRGYAHPRIALFCALGGFVPAAKAKTGGGDASEHASEEESFIAAAAADAVLSVLARLGDGTSPPQAADGALRALWGAHDAGFCRLPVDRVLAAIDGADALRALCGSAPIDLLRSDVLGEAAPTDEAAGQPGVGSAGSQRVVDVDAVLGRVLRTARGSAALELRERLPRVIGDLELEQHGDVPLDEFTVSLFYGAASAACARLCRLLPIAAAAPAASHALSPVLVPAACPPLPLRRLCRIAAPSNTQSASCC
jgi:hypothetical protein